MAVEREVAVRQVEDEPGKGFFQTIIEEGGVERQETVPALYIGDDSYEASRAYIQQQLETGVPVVAYRAKERGQCAVAVNHNLVAVEEVQRFIPAGGFSLEPEWIGLDPAEKGERYIDSYGQGEKTPKLEVKGRNRQTGLPIKITVGFVRD